MMKRTWIVLALVLNLAGCASYPPPLSPMKGQTAVQQNSHCWPSKATM